MAGDNANIIYVDFIEAFDMLSQNYSLVKKEVSYFLKK